MAGPGGEAAIARRLTQPTTRRRETAKTGTVGHRLAAAREELIMALGRPRIQIGNTELVGRSLTFTFPVPLTAQGEASVHQSVRPAFLERVAEDGLVDASAIEGAP